MSDDFEAMSKEEFEDGLVENSIKVDVINFHSGLCVGVGVKTKDPNAVLFLTPMTGIALANEIISACLFISKERNKKQYESIETAPKDGRRIIVADDYQATSVFWDSRGFWNAAEKIEDEPIIFPDTVCYWREANE